MPNYCSVLMCCHAHEDWNRVVPFLTGVNADGEDCQLTFNNVVPMPQYIYTGSIGKTEQELYGEDNCWLKWCYKNWGTKGDAYEVHMDK